MRLAIPHWQDRVSPVFDVASSLLLVEFEDGREMRREETRLVRTDPAGRARELADLNVDVLVCGAISAPLEAGWSSSGVRVISFVCGDVKEIVPAFLRGELPAARFLMPGCRGRRRMRGGDSAMAKGFGQGPGAGMGRGGRGRMGGPPGAGPGGSCVCPKCGEKVPHGQGRPCNQATCPKCGTPMTRA